MSEQPLFPLSAGRFPFPFPTICEEPQSRARTRASPPWNIVKSFMYIPSNRKGKACTSPEKQLPSPPPLKSSLALQAHAATEKKQRPRNATGRNAR